MDNLTQQEFYMKEHHVAKFHGLKGIKANVCTMFNPVSNLLEAMLVTLNLAHK